MLLGGFALPREPTGRTYTQNGSVGGVATRWWYYGQVWPIQKVKMLDPSGCFVFFTKPCSAVRVLLGPEQKIAHLVANTIANKAYLKSTRYLPTLKSCARSLATDFRCGFSVWERCIEVFITFQNVSTRLAKYLLRGKVFAST